MKEQVHTVNRKSASPALLTEGCLKMHPFLQGSSEKFLAHLETFSREVCFEPGTVILSEGDYADRWYLIREGQVQLEANSGGLAPIVIQMLGPGDVLGWSWLYAPYSWHFTARAVEHCEMIELNAPSLLIRAEEDHEFGFELMKRISSQLVHRLQAVRRRLAESTREASRTGVAASAWAT